MVKLVSLCVLSLKVAELLTTLSEDLLYFQLTDLKVNGVEIGTSESWTVHDQDHVCMCVGGPQINPDSMICQKDSQSQHMMVYTAVISSSKKIQRSISKGKSCMG